MKAMTGVKTAVIVGVVGLGVLSAGAFSVYAAESGGSYPSIVQKIAKAFNLDPAKVNDVFKQDQQERMAQRQTQFEDRLNQAIKDGKLTQTQKDAIIAKLEEVKKKREEIMKLAPQDRKAAMQKIMQDLKAWADKNKIDYRQVMGGMMRGMGGGMRGMRGGGGFGRMGHGWGRGGGMMNPQSGTDGGSTDQQPQSGLSVPQGQQL